MQQGKLVIVKNVVGADGTFAFTGTGGSTVPGLFSISTTEGAGSTTFSNVNPDNTYTLAETVPTGYQLESASCTGGVIPGASNAITVGAGKTVICTFNDVQQGTITVIKNTVGADGTFAFTGTGGSTLPASFSEVTRDGTNTIVFNNVNPDNAYSVSEIVPSGWELESSTCSGDNTPSSIAVAAGGSVTCTFNDQKLGTIIVNKVTQGGDGTFQFTTTSLVSENYPLPSTFSITTDSGHGSYVFNTADADQVYSITENVPAGWELEGITCGYDDHTVNPNAIVVPAGKTVTCTVNDQKLGTLVINKVAQGVDNTGTFNFTTTSLGDENYPLPSIFSIAATSGSGSYTFNTADADQVYSITENVPANWELESTTCTGEGNSASHIVVPAGGLVTCTVNNQELAAPSSPPRSRCAGPMLSGFETAGSANAFIALRVLKAWAAR